MKRVICVCSGNICRSPMAAGIVRDRLGKQDIPCVVISAGTLNINGQPASVHAVEACSQIGLDISGHRSQGVSAPLLELADHLVVMSPHHAESLLRIDKRLAPKIVRIWEFSTEPLDEIADPVGLDLAAFVKCRDILVGCLDAWVRRLAALR